MDKEKYEYLKEIVEDYIDVKVENEMLKVVIANIKQDLKYLINRNRYGNYNDIKEMLEEKYGMEFDVKK